MSIDSKTRPPGAPVEKTATFCIVTPTFNSERYIDATIASIVSQAGNFRIRYHIQDGSSRDETVRRVRQWEVRLKQGGFPINCAGVELSFDSSPDSGMYDAINKGFGALGLAEESYMTWLNSDDCLMPGALSLVAQFFERSNDVRWLGGRPCEIDEGGCITRLHDTQVYPQRTLAGGLHEGNHLPFVMQEGTFWRSALWTEVGGLNRALRLAGDFDLWRRMATHASYVAVDSILAGHRRHPGQLTESSAGYYSEVDGVMTGAVAELRDSEWSKYQKWYVRSVSPRDGAYAGQVAVYSSASRQWTIENRPPPTPLGGTVCAQASGVVTAIPGRFLTGFGGEDHAYAHLNLPKGSSMSGPKSTVEFTVGTADSYRVFVRCRNFFEKLGVTLKHGDVTILGVSLPATGHDRDCLLCAEARLDSSNNVLSLELTPPPGVSEAILLVLSCEVIPIVSTRTKLGAWLAKLGV